MSGVISENVECPSCKEKVPKTLYCLSCGYPIYKMDEAETFTTEVKAEAANSQPVEEPIKPVEIDGVKSEEIAVEIKVEEPKLVQPEQMIDTLPLEPSPEDVLKVEDPERKEAIPEVRKDSYPKEKEISESVIEASQEKPSVEVSMPEPIESSIQTKLDENPESKTEVAEDVKEGAVPLEVIEPEPSSEESIQNVVDVTPETEAVKEIVDSIQTEQSIETQPETLSGEVSKVNPVEPNNQPKLDEKQIETPEIHIVEIVAEQETALKEQVTITEEVSLEPAIDEPKIVVEEIAPEPIETPLTSGSETSTFTSPIQSNVEIQSTVKYTPMEESKSIKYIPDSYSRDVVEHLASITSRKLKLIKHYREGNMKEDTFTKLFNNTTQEETNWTTRHNQLTQEATEKISEAKIAHNTAEEALEMLEVRRAIGDASEEEYMVKLPAYRWDLEHCDRVFGEGVERLAYLEGLGGVLGEEELGVLRGLAEVQLNTVDALGVESEELFGRVKESLIQSVKLLG